MSAPLRPPEPLTDDHQLDRFDSGAPTLDDWLKRRAMANQASGATRTYVVCEGKRAVAYYALASGAIAQAGVPGKLRRNMPDTIPVVVLARLAVDANYQGRGLGRALFRDAAENHAAEPAIADRERVAPSLGGMPIPEHGVGGREPNRRGHEQDDDRAKKNTAHRIVSYH